MKNKLPILITSYSIGGALLVVATYLLRDSELINTPWINFILGILPNFGLALCYANLPLLALLLMGRTITRRFDNLFLLISFLIFFIMEFFHGTSFDIWDIAVTILALVITKFAHLKWCSDDEVIVLEKEKEIEF